MRKLVVLLGIAALMSLPLQAGVADDDKDRHSPHQAANQQLTDKDQKVLTKAPLVLESLTSAPDKGIPRNLLEKAECVMVFPDVTKGAFIIGGEHGRGVATCRQDGGEMGPPAFFTVGGASVGWQFGGEQTDFVMLVMDKNGMNNLMRDKFKIGVEASAAAGPVGRTAEASTDSRLGAQLLSWSRSQGLFVGASLDGAVIKPTKDANERLYGHSMTVAQILDGDMSTPQAAKPFVQLAGRLTAQPGMGMAQTHADDNLDRGDINRPYGDQLQPYQADRRQERVAYGSAQTTASGTIVTVNSNELVVRTDDGQRRTYVIDADTERPMDLREGRRVEIDFNDESGKLVATNVQLTSSPGGTGELYGVQYGDKARTDIAATGQRRDRLPQTASPLALLALGGLLSLGGAMAVRRLRR